MATKHADAVFGQIRVPACGRSLRFHLKGPSNGPRCLESMRKTDVSRQVGFHNSAAATVPDLPSDTQGHISGFKNSSWNKFCERRRDSDVQVAENDCWQFLPIWECLRSQRNEWFPTIVVPKHNSIQNLYRLWRGAFVTTRTNIL